MNLKCKKQYYIDEFASLNEGEYYTVLKTGQDVMDNRYWLFSIPNYPDGHGWFYVDKYFETPEEQRESKIDKLLKTKTNEKNTAIRGNNEMEL